MTKIFAKPLTKGEWVKAGVFKIHHYLLLICTGNTVNLSTVDYHSNILIGENVFIWGDIDPGIPISTYALVTSSSIVYN